MLLISVEVCVFFVVDVGFNLLFLSSLLPFVLGQTSLYYWYLIYVYWYSTQLPFHMMHVSYSSNTMGATSKAGTT